MWSQENQFVKFLIQLKVTRFSRSPRELLNVPFGETLQLNSLIQAWIYFNMLLQYPGMELMHEKVLSYGCYCQLRNFERYKNMKEGIVPGTTFTSKLYSSQYHRRGNTS